MCIWSSTSSSKWNPAHVTAAPEGRGDELSVSQWGNGESTQDKEEWTLFSFHDTYSVFYQDTQLMDNNVVSGV